MPYLFEALLFIGFVGAFFAWRELHPGMEPARRFLILAAVFVMFSLLGAAWYGFGRRGETYIPAHMENGVLVPAQSGR